MKLSGGSTTAPLFIAPNSFWTSIVVVLSNHKSVLPYCCVIDARFKESN